MRLIVISPENGTSELKQLPRLFEAGLEYYHIRKPFFNEPDLIKYIQSIPAPFHKNLVLHSYYNLSEAFEIKGIHFTEKEKNKNTHEKPAFQISASFHNLRELLEWKTRYDYVFLSPIFNSISKEGYVSRFRKDELIQALPEIQQDVVALGGISLSNIEEVREMGFKGVALLGAIWSGDNPLEKFLLIKDSIEQK